MLKFIYLCFKIRIFIVKVFSDKRRKQTKRDKIKVKKKHTCGLVILGLLKGIHTVLQDIPLRPIWIIDP